MNIKLTDHQKMIVNSLATGKYASIIDMRRSENRYRFSYKKILVLPRLNSRSVKKLISMGLLHCIADDGAHRFYKLSVDCMQSCMSCKHSHFGAANIEVSRARCDNKKIKKTFIDNPHAWCNCHECDFE